MDRVAARKVLWLESALSILFGLRTLIVYIFSYLHNSCKIHVSLAYLAEHHHARLKKHHWSKRLFRITIAAGLAPFLGKAASLASVDRDGHLHSVPHVRHSELIVVVVGAIYLARFWYSRPMPEEWIPSPRTKISAIPSWQVRDGQICGPKNGARQRPSPVHLLAPPDQPALVSPPLPLLNEQCIPLQPLRDPQVVDLAAPGTWPRRGPTPVSLRVPDRKMAATPSLYSRCSLAKDTEISFGILDYYTRDPSPLPSPGLPPPPQPPPPPKVDPAIKKLDFQLSSTALRSAEPRKKSPSALSTTQGESTRVQQQATPGAVAATKETTPLLARPRAQTQQGMHNRSYSLFPAVNESPSPIIKVPNPADRTLSPGTSLSEAQKYQQPDPSYRPRKQSLTSSVRSRKDSFTSYRSGSRRGPLRILSSDSTTSTSRRTVSSASNSPPGQGRWSEDTIASPVLATTPGPRTSFGSLLQGIGEHSDSYPACFFEDEDEASPLRRKFTWKRVGSVTVKEIQPVSRGGRGRFDDREGFGLRLKRLVLCGGCGRQRSPKRRDTI